MLKPTMMSSLIMAVLLGLTGSCDAAFTFFTDRAAWEAEVSARSWLFAEENFDAFANGTPIPSFTVGAGTLPAGGIQFNPGSGSGTVSVGRLIPSTGSAVRFGTVGVSSTSGSVIGDLLGIGMDITLDFSTLQRGLNLFNSSGSFMEGSTPLPGNGFVGVLFDTSNEARGFNFAQFGSNGGADNLVVAVADVPEPATFALGSLGLLGIIGRRRKQA